MTLRVTVVDEETGDTDTQYVREGDYVLTVHDPCHLAHALPVDGGRTHVLVVEGRIVEGH